MSEADVFGVGADYIHGRCIDKANFPGLAEALLERICPQLCSADRQLSMRYKGYATRDLWAGP